jgi:hypothetical protein
MLLNLLLHLGQVKASFRTCILTGLGFKTLISSLKLSQSSVRAILPKRAAANGLVYQTHPENTCLYFSKVFHTASHLAHEMEMQLSVAHWCSSMSGQVISSHLSSTSWLPASSALTDASRSNGRPSNAELLRQANVGL